MSYILEALRKAEAERRRGAVPDLHAQALPAGTGSIAAAAPRSSLRIGLIGAGLLAIAAAAAWLLLGRQEAPTRVATVLPTPAAPSPAAPASNPLPSELPPPAVPAPSAPAADVVAAPEKASAPARKSQSSVKRDRPTAATKASTQASPAKAASATPSAEPARVPALAELPGDLRQQVPALAIGGSVYSPQASARMVVVNGQVFQEGNALSPELKLEQIKPKSAVFSIRGTRFEVPL